MFDQISETLDVSCNLTVELISHRFTPSSKEVLKTWYPNSKLEMDQQQRVIKRNKFGGIKYVYDASMMKTLRRYFEQEINRRFPHAQILYWT